jgi:hypothetical protein
VVVFEAVSVVEGTMALVAGVAVIVGPCGGDLAVGGDPGLAAVVDVAGVLAVGTDDAGG